MTEDLDQEQRDRVHVLPFVRSDQEGHKNLGRMTCSLLLCDIIGACISSLSKSQNLYRCIEHYESTVENSYRSLSIVRELSRNLIGAILRNIDSYF